MEKEKGIDLDGDGGGRVPPSPGPWTINGHTIEADDPRLWLRNPKTGAGVVATFPSAPKARFPKEARSKWDAVSRSNAELVARIGNRPRMNLDRFRNAEEALGTFIKEFYHESDDEWRNGRGTRLSDAVKWLFTEI